MSSTDSYQLRSALYEVEDKIRDNNRYIASVREELKEKRDIDQKVLEGIVRIIELLENTGNK